MALDITQITNLCASILNASPDTYGTISDPLHPSAEIVDAIKSADRQVAQTIIDTADHRLRAMYATLKSYTGSIPSNTYGIVTDPIAGVVVDGKPGKFVPPDVLRNLINDALTLTTKDTGYYTVEGPLLGAIYASSLAVAVYKYVEPSGSTLASPDEYLMGVVCGALSILFPKEGAFVEAANHFGTMFLKMLDMIRQGATTLPAIPAFVAGKR